MSTGLSVNRGVYSISWLARTNSHFTRAPTDSVSSMCYNTEWTVLSWELWGTLNLGHHWQPWVDLNSIPLVGTSIIITVVFWSQPGYISLTGHVEHYPSPLAAGLPGYSVYSAFKQSLYELSAVKQPIFHVWVFTLTVDVFPRPYVFLHSVFQPFHYLLKGGYPNKVAPVLNIQGYWVTELLNVCLWVCWFVGPNPLVYW